MHEIKDLIRVKDDKSYLFQSIDGNYRLWVPFGHGYKVTEWYKNCRPREIRFLETRDFMNVVSGLLDSLYYDGSLNTKVYELNQEEDIDKIKMMNELIK